MKKLNTTGTYNQVRLAVVGCGDMARHHLRDILSSGTGTVTAVCEPSTEAYARTCALFDAENEPPPPNFKELGTLLATFDGALDAALIASPHAFHHDQAVACMRSGLDVLLEKPMVMTAVEAKSLIDCRDETETLLVVAFPGSLSPRIRAASRLIRTGEAGQLLSISATVWQNWSTNTAGTWRQQPELSGGGFMFDTGAHMLNTVVDLAGEDFVEVAAMMKDSPVDVEYSGVVIGRLESGALVTMHACGETIEACASSVNIFTSRAIMKTGVWGEFLEVESADVEVDNRLGQQLPGVWQQFVSVRQGTLPNPCPPEVGLRMARLWDAVQQSAESGGRPVNVDNVANQAAR